MYKSTYKDPKDLYNRKIEKLQQLKYKFIKVHSPINGVRGHTWTLSILFGKSIIRVDFFVDQTDRYQSWENKNSSTIPHSNCLTNSGLQSTTA